MRTKLKKPDIMIYMYEYPNKPGKYVILEWSDANDNMQDTIVETTIDGDGHEIPANVRSFILDGRVE